MKYGVGDIVVICAKKHGHGFEIGEKVRIIEDWPITYNAVSLNNDERWAVSEEEIQFDSDTVEHILFNMGYR